MNKGEGGRGIGELISNCFMFGYLTVRSIIYLNES